MDNQTGLLRIVGLTFEFFYTLKFKGQGGSQHNTTRVLKKDKQLMKYICKGEYNEIKDKLVVLIDLNNSNSYQAYNLLERILQVY